MYENFGLYFKVTAFQCHGMPHLCRNLYWEDTTAFPEGKILVWLYLNRRNIFVFSGHNSQRRFRSHTPFSTKTSYSSNTYSHFLEDDEEITGIIDEYMKYGRSGWGQNKEHLEHGVVSSDHMPDVGNEGYISVLNIIILHKNWKGNMKYSL